jgi:hypothetical protein
MNNEDERIEVNVVAHAKLDVNDITDVAWVPPNKKERGYEAQGYHLVTMADGTKLTVDSSSPDVSTLGDFAELFWHRKNTPN